MCHTQSCTLGSVRQTWSCLQDSYPCAGETGIERVITSTGGVTTWMPCAGEGRNHAFWSPHCSNQKNAPISLEIGLCKFSSGWGGNTAVPFPNWNSPPLCFWEAQMPWRSPSNNNWDCSQLWMVLVDFSSNKTTNHFITSEIAKK